MIRRREIKAALVRSQRLQRVPSCPINLSPPLLNLTPSWIALFRSFVQNFCNTSMHSELLQIDLLLPDLSHDFLLFKIFLFILLHSWKRFGWIIQVYPCFLMPFGTLFLNSLLNIHIFFSWRLCHSSPCDLCWNGRDASTVTGGMGKETKMRLSCT